MMESEYELNCEGPQTVTLPAIFGNPLRYVLRSLPGQPVTICYEGQRPYTLPAGESVMFQPRRKWFGLFGRKVWRRITRSLRQDGQDTEGVRMTDRLTIELAAKAGYEHSMKSLDVVYPETAGQFTWDNENDVCKEDWRERARIMLEILRSEYSDNEKNNVK